MTNSMRKPLFIFGIILITFVCAGFTFVLTQIILPLLGLIILSIPGSYPIAAPDAFPDTDIVYFGGKGLGFVNADGSDQESFRFRTLGHSVLDEGIEIFLMTSDHKTLITVYTGYGTYEGTAYLTHPGETAVTCGWDGIIQVAPDQKHILVGTEHGHDEYRLTDCGTGNGAERTIGEFKGVLSPDEQYSVETQYGWNEEKYRNKSDLILHNLVTREERVIEDGRFPAWSRDSQWLAYTGIDGIYIIGTAPIAEPRRVVTIESSDIYFVLYDDSKYPPVVSWSPDGKWLVYHTENEHPNGETIDYYYSIFKVNVETGEAIKLLDSGMFPYWIWPGEKP